MNLLVVIPARYGSTRFPGKPLARIKGRPMILHVLDKVRALGNHARIVIATDDERILSVVREAGGEAIMTNKDHVNGTSRCAEVVSLLGEAVDVVLNVQGDEPGISVDALSDLVNVFQDQEVRIASLMNRITDIDRFQDPNCVKVVTDLKGNALYFSRSAIPFTRDPLPAEPLAFQHQGVYAFRPDSLLEVVNLAPTALEQSESLEQLRWLEHGYQIRMVETAHISRGVDTPEDLNHFDR